MLISIPPSLAVRESIESRPTGLLTIAEEFDIALELKYDNARQFYIRIATGELEGRDLPPIFTNVMRRKNYIECQTLELMKRNQKVRWPMDFFELHPDYCRSTCHTRK
jgi:DNA mismatch repair protein MSH4